MRVPKPLLAALLIVGSLAGGLRAGAEQPTPSLPTLSSCLRTVPTRVHVKDEFTIATNNPAIPPWFVDDKPSNGKGYESAVAYELATTLGFKRTAVDWYAEPYELSERAGTKPFDVDINEIVYNARLSSKVSFSSSYYNVNQSLVALKSDRIAARHDPAELRSYLYGDPAGSPGLALIRTKIKPTRAPILYRSLSDAIAALAAKKIDAIVVDTPSGQYIATQQLRGAVQVGQFHTTSEHYSLVLQRGSPLVGCVDAALAAISKSGKLVDMSRSFLGVYNSIPFLRP